MVREFEIVGAAEVGVVIEAVELSNMDSFCRLLRRERLMGEGEFVLRFEYAVCGGVYQDTGEVIRMKVGSAEDLAGLALQNGALFLAS